LQLWQKKSQSKPPLEGDQTPNNSASDVVLIWLHGVVQGMVEWRLFSSPPVYLDYFLVK